MKKLNRSIILLAVSPALLFTTVGCQDFFEDFPIDTFGLPGEDSDSGFGTTGVDSKPTGTSDGSSESTGSVKGCADPNDPTSPIISVTADIMGNQTWTCDNIFVLESQVAVSGGTLTIEPGTTIKGKTGSALIVEKDARLNAVGTADKPIVFTSNNISGNKVRGDWGGLIFLGRAISNLGVNIPAEGFPTPRTYGGTDATHNCGTLEYVRVEWAGFALAADSELNGITFYACGSETKVDYVQSHMGLDDGIEWFGGGFDSSHIVVTGAQDDALDFDQGFTGKLQHVFVQMDPSIGDSSIESSNSRMDTSSEPITRPLIANATIVGSGINGAQWGGGGVDLNHGSHIELYNSMVVNTTSPALFLEGKAVREGVFNGSTKIAGNIFSTSDENALAVLVSNDFGSSPQSVVDWLEDATRKNAIQGAAALPSLRWSAPNIQPSAGSLADTGAVELPSSADFADAPYIGAVQPGKGTNWTQASWINYSLR